jgi:uncharacterized iron-regulated membrane protein
MFVSAFGLLVVMLSVTGVYIWWKKRRARKRHVAGAAVQTMLAQESH